MRGRRRPAQALRLAIDCMPLEARKAMLHGTEHNEIIVGAYTDRDGGVCPMLAAHRNGGRTSLASFARAWDRYTAPRKPRRATEREIRTLRTMLSASIAMEEGAYEGDLAEAVAEHQALKARRPKASPRPEARPGDPDRSKELRTRHGWSWLRPFRRLDEYEAALRQLEEPEIEQRELERV